MEEIVFKLDRFEGSLDLLLSLVAKHKMSLYDIQIDLLVDQYLDFIGHVPAGDLESASEFLEMASRLVYLKSAMLLPSHEEETKKLKQELTGELMAYKACRMAAQNLGRIWRGDSVFCRSPADLPQDKTYRGIHPPSRVLISYLSAIGRSKRKQPPPKEAFSAIIHRRVVPVSSRMLFILRSLRRRGTVFLKSLYMRSSDRSEMVATFLAVLELIRSRRICVDDEERVTPLSPPGSRKKSAAKEEGST